MRCGDCWTLSGCTSDRMRRRVAVAGHRGPTWRDKQAVTPSTRQSPSAKARRSDHAAGRGARQRSAQAIWNWAEVEARCDGIVGNRYRHLRCPAAVPSFVQRILGRSIEEAVSGNKCAAVAFLTMPPCSTRSGSTLEQCGRRLCQLFSSDSWDERPQCAALDASPSRRTEPRCSVGIRRWGVRHRN